MTRPRSIRHGDSTIRYTVVRSARRKKTLTITIDPGNGVRVLVPSRTPNTEIEAITRTRNSREWIELFNGVGVPAGYIYAIDEVFEDPQVKHLEMAAPAKHPVLGDIELVAQPIKMSAAEFAVRSPTPELGEHTDEVLGEHGYTSAEIEALRTAGAI